MDPEEGSPWPADPAAPPPEPGGMSRREGKHRDWLGRPGKGPPAGGGWTARRRRRPRAGLEAGGDHCFFTHRYHIGYRDYHSYRFAAVTVPTGLNR
jgi:hypothetical protein